MTRNIKTISKGNFKLRTPEGNYVTKEVKMTEEASSKDTVFGMSIVYDWIMWKGKKWQVLGVRENTEADEPYIWKPLKEE
ncbi:MAG: hypothetical protein ACOCRK_06220 [bacterium]